MPRPAPRITPLAFLALLACLSPWAAWVVPAQASSPSDEDIKAAIERMKAYLLQKQHRDEGHWEDLFEHGNAGEGAFTSMAALALMLGGEPAQRPEIARAVQFLERTPNEHTYGKSLRSHLWAQLPDRYLPLLEKDARWLHKWAADERGRFDYTARPLTPKPEDVLRFDHSCSHYGVLGLWEAQKRGVGVPREFWIAVQDHWIKAQKKGGGWSYTDRPDEAPYGSMTAAGVTVLLIAQQQLYRDSLTPDARIQRAIAEGIGWLDERFSGHRNPLRDGQTGYYLYAIERVALASGLRTLNREDWFRVGARYFLEQQRPDGSVAGSPVDTCFGLMFLARGNVPVWIAKLRPPAQPPAPPAAWNNRPNDLWFLTDFLSTHVEQELSWQLLDADAPLAQWMATPAVFLASHQAVQLTPAQQALLKRYLDLGGLLIASPDNGSEAFSRSIRELASSLYPTLEFRQLPPTHPLFNAQYALGDAAGQRVHALSNGARELILLPERDWGHTFQTERYEGNKGTNTLRIAANLFAWLTDRGRLLPNRLVPRHISPEPGRQRTGTLRVARARHKGEWDADLAAWDQVAAQLFNVSGLQVENVEPIDLASIGSSSVPLIHLAGVRPLQLTEAEKSSILRYTRAGGLLLVETLGGPGQTADQPGFALSVERQLAPVFRTAARALPEDHPLLTGKGLAAAYDNRKIDWRPDTLVRLRSKPRQQFSVFEQRGRAAVILSDLDLSQGAMGLPRLSVTGYAPGSAQRLLSNLLVFAHQQTVK